MSNCATEEKKKRANWSEEELKELKTICREINIWKLLDGRSKKNAQAYALVASQLRSRGYNRNAKQVQFKFQGLKRNHRENKKHNNTSGVNPTPLDPDMSELLDTRPSAVMMNVGGVDLAALHNSAQDLLEKGRVSAAVMFSHMEILSHIFVDT